MWAVGADIGQARDFAAIAAVERRAAEFISAMSSGCRWEPHIWSSSSASARSTTPCRAPATWSSTAGMHDDLVLAVALAMWRL
jgi:hypothetical protein